ncbi:MAG: hypothetical protein ACD_30C00111G0008 [uncultured bacterium]|uniref:Inositol monophosphatase n=3 Tax=Candidatus Daviesiibacteriota TaxID=1752718 RepID=A0A0G0H8B6_9BACT|nr:MAG: hypothetical protein ACD_30C00111G0008 [uncultured bacterium]KKQ08334.1 MAG: hypothetical protein US19_C0027G0011 [Candidatus Daviesbacteria bacterium GW2011_GWB1_36_5]KKQ15190.1 MAG: hypothetical protein US28_C0021G0021 [Candidatus Daviesbacteria bacterium GW2011_GWA1_36_8]OGE36237.1 MAG: hypothetical protein A3E66_05535 [Candidatus Daviesbacteria bacterium RIFCSPHIGHO2_12_FULL_37_16]
MSAYTLESAIGTLGNRVLQKTKIIHDSLGKAGEEYVRKNQHGEKALLADIECESVVLEILKRSGLSMLVHSEEHGKVFLGIGKPEFTAFLDGLDGSAVYKKERGSGRYGTMLGIYKGNDPDYGDYLFGGVMEHSTDRLFYAVAGRGSWVVENGRKSRVRTAQADSLNPAEVRMQANTHFDWLFDSQVITGMLSKLPGFEYKSMNCSAVHVIDLASGDTDVMLEATRKGNLEFAAGFPLISEAGGILMDIRGRDLRDLKISEFGQDGYYPVIGLANPGLRQPFLDLVKAAEKTQK